MDDSIWCHDCAVALKKRLARLSDGVAFLLADALHQSHSSRTPTEAVDEFLRSAGHSAAPRRMTTQPTAACS